jgi:hypothetical protein
MGRRDDARVLLDEALLRDPLHAVARALREGPLGETIAHPVEEPLTVS